MQHAHLGQLKSITKTCAGAMACALIYFSSLPCFPMVNSTFSRVPDQPKPSHNKQNLKNLREDEEYVRSAEANLRAHEHASKDELDSARSPVLGGLQAVAFAKSMVGDYVGAVDTFNTESVLWNKYHGSPIVIGSIEEDLKNIETSHAVNAIDAIVQASKSRQIVILNEAHHVAYDRVFANRLAKKLKKIGYEYMACETFNGDDNNVLAKGYVAEGTGYFSREPMYVNLLTDAISDGWKFISYEPSGSDGSREYGMAKNLVERIFSKDPKAKVFVYVGYSHAEKFPASHNKVDGSKMAAQLQRLTGIDALTVDQTTLYDHYESDQQAAYYRRALKKVHGITPSVLVASNGRSLKFSGDSMRYDFEVVHPRYVMDAGTGRPEWMEAHTMGDLKPRAIPGDLLPIKGTRLIYAFRTNSPKDAAPFDVVMVKAGEAAPKVMLPSGDFSFEYED